MNWTTALNAVRNKRSSTSLARGELRGLARACSQTSPTWSFISPENVVTLLHKLKKGEISPKTRNLGFLCSFYRPKDQNIALKILFSRLTRACSLPGWRRRWRGWRWSWCSRRSCSCRGASRRCPRPTRRWTRARADRAPPRSGRRASPAGPGRPPSCLWQRGFF